MFKNNNEFEKWCAKCDYDKATVELITRIRESDPSRAVSGKRKNVCGIYPSMKMGKSIQFESHTVELAGLYLKEHDNSVIEMYDQPEKIKITYMSKGRTVTSYSTPDFFVLYDHKAGWEEWKTEEELLEKSKTSDKYVFHDGEWHCPSGEEYAKKFGLHFWVKSSKDINNIVVRNLVFLEDYLLDLNRELKPESEKTIVEAVKKSFPISLSKLITQFDSDDIYYLIAQEKLYVDLDSELLSEPEYTYIYSDKTAAVAYKSSKDLNTSPMFENHSLNILPGTHVIWDSIAWTIVNVGNDSISLSSEKSFIEIPKNQFFDLVCKKSIVNDENSLLVEKDSYIFNKISSASKEDLDEANRRYKLILPVLEGGKIGDIKNCPVTSKTIKNWISRYREAERLYGCGYIGLIPNTKKRGNRIPHLPDSTFQVVERIINDNKNPTNQSYKVLYGKVENECDAHGIIAPSIKTFIKMIKGTKDWIQSTEGSRVNYCKVEPFYWDLDDSTPRHGERPFEIAHIDHTPMDTELSHTKTGKNLGRAWLTIMMDAFSRRVLAFFITFDEPSYRSDMMVMRECVRKYNRLPQIIVTDNGRDFKSTYFESLLSYYRVTLKIRPPHRARFGSVGERLFGTTMSQLIHNLRGNTKVMKNVRQVTKSVNPKNFAVWNLGKLYDLLTSYFYEFYDTQEHTSLGESPREAFERAIKISGSRPFRFIPYNQDFIIMTLPSIKRNNGTAKIDSQRGIKVNYFYYHCDAFENPYLNGERVSVRYDPWNMGIVYAYVNSEWTLCRSEYFRIFNRRTEKEIEIATQEILKQRSNHAKKSDISARMLADFIRDAEKTEALLMQQLKDLEMLPQQKVILGNDIIPDEETKIPKSSTNMHADSMHDFDISKIECFENYDWNNTENDKTE